MPNFFSSLADCFRTKTAVRNVAHEVLSRKNQYGSQPFSIFHEKDAIQIHGDQINHHLQGIKSSEPIIYLNIKNTNQPILFDQHGNQMFLSPLSSLRWDKFADSLSGEVSITFGYRRALAQFQPLPVEHAIILVKDTAGHAAMFGYNRFGNKESIPLANDLKVVFNHKHYYLYDALTIRGNPLQAKQFFEKLYTLSKEMPFNFVGNNCFTPLILSLIDGVRNGFAAAKDFEARLLIAVGSKHNLGQGVTLNKILGQKTLNLSKKIIASQGIK